MILAIVDTKVFSLVLFPEAILKTPVPLWLARMFAFTPDIQGRVVDGALATQIACKACVLCRWLLSPGS
jgi:hypothetical protein